MSKRILHKDILYCTIFYVNLQFLNTYLDFSYNILGDFMAIVYTDRLYTTDLLYDNIRTLLFTYPFLQVEAIGYSVLGNPISCIRIGRGSNQVFYSASIHANESITTNILMKFIEDFCIAYTNNSNIYNVNARNIFRNSSIYIVPMCNPDGVNLVNGFYDTRKLYL